MIVYKVFRFSLVLSLLFLTGLAYVFIDSYYLRSLRTVNNINDPRWRVFDLNSRQATEGDIYNTAEVPVITRVKEIAPRKLRFWFSPPVKTTSWTVQDMNTGEILWEGDYPEIQFDDQPYEGKICFIPEGVSLLKPLCINLDFYPTEYYQKKGLDWPDNFYTPDSDIPFSLKTPYSVNEWAGLDEEDSELIKAREILGNTVDKTGNTLERSEQVFAFVMNKIVDASGTPSDKVQSASPLETYNLMVSGKGEGWCENKALVYYLFANAAGIKTRLVDQAGKFGPLKLSGHYYCESWIPEHAKWMYVDPQMQIANIKNRDGTPLHTVDIKKLVDLNALTGTTATLYRKGQLIRVDGSTIYSKIKGGLTGELVLAYKFGYANNKNYSKIKSFLKYTTLLYAPFTLPKWYLFKYFFMYGSAVFILITFLTGLFLMLSKKSYNGKTRNH